MREEPILTDEDRRAWALWQRTAEAHARTRAFRARVDRTRGLVGEALSTEPHACLMWSGGKDSTVMTHLVCVDMGARIAVGSEKDDLDFPGEEDYVRGLAAAWGLDLHVLHPPISPAAWLAEHARQLLADDDMHSRAAGLSKACFYDVVETWSQPYGLMFLGLRQEESRGRRMNRAKRGALYAKRRRFGEGTQWVSTPLVDWRGIDVYAYAVSRGIELLPMYRCVGLMHEEEPWFIRKSWWVPGSHAQWGGIAWLRRYYPSLYGRLCRMMPDASRHA